MGSKIGDSYCLDCAKCFPNHKVFEIHWKSCHNNLGQARPYVCTKCWDSNFCDRGTRNRHQRRCTMDDRRPEKRVHRSNEDPAPLPSPLEISSELPDNDDRAPAPVAVAGDVPWIMARLALLESKEGVSATAIDTVLGIISRCGVPLPPSVQSYKDVRKFCDNAFVASAVQDMDAGAAVAGTALEDIAEETSIGVRRARRNAPTKWYALDVYEKVRQLYDGEWRQEIIQRLSEHQDAKTRGDTSCSCVIDGSAYQESDFFRSHPTAAALMLYLDGVSIGEMTGKIHFSHCVYFCYAGLFVHGSIYLVYVQFFAHVMICCFVSIDQHTIQLNFCGICI